MKKLLFMLLAVVPVTSMGQSPGSLAGPVVGYLFDGSAKMFRPISGIMGSSTVGEPIVAGLQMSFGVSLPDSRHVIAAPDTGLDLVSIDMGVLPPVVRAIQGAEKSVSEISVSPLGRAAALLYSSSRRVQIVTGLPNTPSIALEIPAEGMPPGVIQHVAVNDDASALLMSIADQDIETIYRWNRTEGYRVLAPVAHVEALGFVGTSDAVYADSVRNEVFLVHVVKGEWSIQFIAGGSDGVSRPLGVGITSNSEIHVANADSGTVMTFDFTGHLLRTLSCGCNVSGLFPLAPDTFRLTDGLQQTIYLLNGSVFGNEITFVPPVR
jgi:hypothetical protein